MYMYYQNGKKISFNDYVYMVFLQLLCDEILSEFEAADFDEFMVKHFFTWFSIADNFNGFFSLLHYIQPLKTVHRGKFLLLDIQIIW